MRTKTLALGFIGFLLLLSPSVAFADGRVVTTSPVQDSTLISVPTEVSLVFDGNLQTLGAAVINSITFTTDAGAVISDAVTRVSGNSISSTVAQAEESAKARPKGLVVAALVLLAGILAIVQKKRKR